MFAWTRKITPRRGWRAFTGEVGIIVLGVLIAVGIGKVAEAIDWRDKVTSATATLDQEISETDDFNMSERRRVSPCLRRQLDRLRAAVLTAGSAGARVAIYADSGQQRVYIHPNRAWTTSSWESVVADNVPAHMSVEDRSLYRFHFDNMRRMDLLNAEERIAAADLVPLHDGLRLDPATRIELLRVIARERSRIDLMDLISRQSQTNLRDRGRRYIMPAGDRSSLNTERWCRANGLF